MKRRNEPSLLWLIPFFLYVIFVAFKTYDFFSSQSSTQLYYQFLIAFHLNYFIPYFLNITSVVLNDLSIIPFFLYMTQIYILSPKFWRILFVIRVAFDLTGRSYEFACLKSLVYQDLSTPLLIVFTTLALMAPSYIAYYLYAFEWKRK